MENASKALIMAGGMLLAILIISLLIYAWSLFSKYQASQDSLSEIEDVSKFNEQFANYERDGIQGYEILSLVNKVIDYNYRKSNAGGAKNDEKYTPITLIIDLKDNQNKNKLTPDGTVRLFTSLKYTQSAVSNAFLDILIETGKIETRYGGVDSATKIAKGFESMKALNDDAAIKKFKSYCTNATTSSSITTKDDVLGERENAYAYWEYIQFKKGIFKFVSSPDEYDKTSGRIVKMTFQFTGNFN